MLTAPRVIAYKWQHFYLFLFFMYVLLILTVQLINGFTRVCRPVMPPVEYEPTTPVCVPALDHTRQQAP